MGVSPRVNKTLTPNPHLQFQKKPARSLRRGFEFQCRLIKTSRPLRPLRITYRPVWMVGASVAN